MKREKQRSQGSNANPFKKQQEVSVAGRERGKGKVRRDEVRSKRRQETGGLSLL